MQLWNRQRDQEKLTKKGKFSPQASPTSGHSPRKDVGYLLALAGGYKPPTRLPFWGLPSVIMRHHEVTEQGSSLASHRVCHSYTLAHWRVSQVQQKTCLLGEQRTRAPRILTLSWRILDKPPRWKFVAEPQKTLIFLPPEEKNSIWGQWRSLIAQTFCVIQFY